MCSGAIATHSGLMITLAAIISSKIPDSIDLISEIIVMNVNAKELMFCEGIRYVNVSELICKHYFNSILFLAAFGCNFIIFCR